MARKTNQACEHVINELIAEAVIDCHDEDEQHAGLLAMVQDRVVCPFRAKVIGETVEVVELGWPDCGHGIIAVCKYKGKTYPVDVNSLEWIEPLPEGFEWIEAYMTWRQGAD